MRRYRLAPQGLQALVCNEEAIGLPGPGEVQIEMRAAAINARDVGILHGQYSPAARVTPLSDGSGTIVTVGPGVEELRPGDDVITCFYEAWPAGRATMENHKRSLGCERDGVLSQRINLPASAVVAKPPTMTHPEAATLTCAGTTAWSALFTAGQIGPGDHVVVQGTGGVAIFALQFAKMAGATVTLISSSDEKLERGRLLGADHTINYRRTADWAAGVQEQTEGRGADLVVELGGGQTLAQSLECIRMDGMIAVIGLLSGVAANIPLIKILTSHARLHGITVGNRSEMEEMIWACNKADLKPVVDRSYSFENASAAYEDLPRGAHFGKLVIEFD